MSRFLIVYIFLNLTLVLGGCGAASSGSGIIDDSSDLEKFWLVEESDDPSALAESFQISNTSSQQSKVVAANQSEVDLPAGSYSIVISGEPGLAGIRMQVGDRMFF